MFQIFRNVENHVFSSWWGKKEKKIGPIGAYRPKNMFLRKLKILIIFSWFLWFRNARFRNVRFRNVRFRNVVVSKSPVSKCRGALVPVWTIGDFGMFLDSGRLLVSSRSTTGNLIFLLAVNGRFDVGWSSAGALLYINTIKKKVHKNFFRTFIENIEKKVFGQQLHGSMIFSCSFFSLSNKTFEMVVRIPHFNK